MIEDSPNSSINHRAKPRWMKLILVLVPAWLIISSAFGLWLYFEREKDEKGKPNFFSTSTVTTESIVNDFRILTEVIGPRHQFSATDGLVRTSAMIDSALGRTNAGFEVSKYEGIPTTEKSQPFLDILVAGGSGKDTETTWILVPYDAPFDAITKRGAATASSLTVALATAQLMAKQSMEKPVRFLFVPSIHSDSQDLSPTLKRLQTILGKASEGKQILYLGNMLHPGNLTSFSTGTSSTVAKDAELLQKQIDQFPATAQICNSLAALGYRVSMMASETNEPMSDTLLDLITPPAEILSGHAESLRAYVEAISKDKKN